MRKILPLVLGLAFVSTACESKPEAKKEPAQAAKPKVTAAPEPPPDPHRNDYKKPTVEGKVAFAGLKDGSKIEGKDFMGMIAADLSFEVEGMAVAEEGPVKVNTGHFVVLVDGEAIPEKSVAKEKGNAVRNFGKGEKKAVIPLKEGKHTLTLQFVDARGRSYGEAWSSTINVTAKAAK